MCGFLYEKGVQEFSRSMAGGGKYQNFTMQVLFVANKGRSYRRICTEHSRLRHAFEAF